MAALAGAATRATAAALAAAAWSCFCAPPAIPPASAATIRVPADRPTIAAALDIAGPGDTVSVAPGTYAERVEHSSGAVLRAEGGPGSVILEGGGAGAVITCVSPVPGTSVEGLVLRGGAGEPDLGLRVGGAVVARGGRLKLVDVRIEENSADLGGGIFCEGSEVSWTGGVLTANAGLYGGGWFALGGSLRLHGVAVADNTAQSGGGGYADGLESLELVSCVYKGNTAREQGGGLFLAATGAAINDTRFESNAAAARGGALYLASGCLAALGYAVFVDNSAALSGGALHVACEGPAGTACSEANLFHVDLVANRAPGSGAASVYGAARLAATASLVARNEGGLACLSPQALIEVSCSAVFSNESSPTQTDCLPLYSDTLDIDPRLCDIPGHDLGRCANSPLLSPPSCGAPFLGAVGAACGPCGPTPTRPTTWGSLKARYR